MDGKGLKQLRTATHTLSRAWSPVNVPLNVIEVGGMVGLGGVGVENTGGVFPFVAKALGSSHTRPGEASNSVIALTVGLNRFAENPQGSW